MTTAVKFLLDTNILSELVRRPQGMLAERLAKEGESSLCTSVVVAAELRFGALKSGSVRLQRQVDLLLSAIKVLPLEEPIDQAYAILRHHLESRGEPIGPNDMLIAAQALSMDCTVVTANSREFSRVPGLRVQNWLQA